MLENFEQMIIPNFGSLENQQDFQTPEFVSITTLSYICISLPEIVHKVEECVRVCVFNEFCSSVVPGLSGDPVAVSVLGVLVFSGEQDAGLQLLSIVLHRFDLHTAIIIANGSSS